MTECAKEALAQLQGCRAIRPFGGFSGLSWADTHERVDAELPAGIVGPVPALLVPSEQGERGDSTPSRGSREQRGLAMKSQRWGHRKVMLSRRRSKS